MKRQVNLIHAGVAVKGDQSREAIQLVKASKNHGVPPNCGMSLNIRNSTISTQGGNLLCKVLQHHDYYLTALNLKFCFLSFEHIQQISSSLRTNKTLVKLDLSNNGLKHFTARYFLDAMLINEHLKIVNFHGNLLDD
jgi:Ran GTPase-activating protein (RanGAP) involved in mRNA processing and transport